MINYRRHVPFLCFLSVSTNIISHKKENVNKYIAIFFAYVQIFASFSRIPSEIARF